MAEDAKDWFVRTKAGAVYGPATLESLIEWAKDGRIEPTGFVSHDRISWTPAQCMAELQMKWLIETEPGKVFGPFTREVVSSLFREKQVPEGAKAYRLHEFSIDEDPPPVIVEKIVEVPVEKIVEKIVEVPVPEPPRTALVVPEAVEPVSATPPPRTPGGIFGDLSPKKLAALETAARRELAAAHRHGIGGGFGIFGGKRG